MNIKKLGCELEYSSYSELKEHNVAAQGWSDWGDLSFMFHNQEELSKYLDIISDEIRAGKNAFNQIMLDIKAHDIILAFEGNSVKGIAEVPDTFVYYYDKTIDTYRNCIFPLNWVDWEDFCKDPNIRAQGGQGVEGIVNCMNPPSLVQYIENNWENYKKEHQYSIQLDQCNDKLKQLLDNLSSRQKESKENFIKLLYNNNNKHMITNIANLLRNNHNLILTGAPGTGKTHLAKQIAAQIILGKEYDEKVASDEEKEKMKTQSAFVQFHPSYDYTDFVEGLRPIKDGDKLGFQRKDGVFKDFCKKAHKANLKQQIIEEYHAAYKKIKNNELTEIPVREGHTKKTFCEDNRQWGLTTGKERSRNGKLGDLAYLASIEKLIDSGFYNRKQLEEFKGNLRDIIGGNDSDIKYVLCYLFDCIDNKKKSSMPPYVFIIDEINRGEISKIFGELFFSIDPGYRGLNGIVATQYQNLIPKEKDTDFDPNDADVFRNGFYVPDNVYIIGTMNDIDRSVESMDFAMRRRFAWHEVSAKDSKSMLYNKDAWWPELMPDEQVIKDIEKRMGKLNDCILKIQGLSSAYQIGAAYFLKLKNYLNNGNVTNDSWDKLWNNHLNGLLFEYLRGLPNADEELKELMNAYNADTN